MINYLKKHKLAILAIILLLIVFCLVAIPIYYYYNQFGDFNRSSKPEDWGVFGDYLGGILNPIISLLSLIILGYLTYIVSRHGAKENKSLFFLEQRVYAYKELTQALDDINAVSDALGIHLTKIHFRIKMAKDKGEVNRLDEGLMVIDTMNSVTKFYNTLLNFKLKHGHLFNYNFDSNEYQAILKETKVYVDSMMEIKMKFAGELDDNDDAKSEMFLSSDYMESLKSIVNELKKELI
jgi:hypothetical protein